MYAVCELATCMCLLCQIHCTVCHTALTNFDTPNRKRKCRVPSSAHHIHACLFCICSNVLFHASHICVCSFSFENVLYNTLKWCANARNKQIMKHYVQYIYRNKNRFVEDWMEREWQYLSLSLFLETSILIECR